MTDPQRYNITWTTPSDDASGSMPLGNGDIGLNAWVEPNGDLRFYISKTDSWGDNGRLLKVGCVRFSLDPAPVLASFAQTLHLESATLVVQYGAGGRWWGNPPALGRCQTAHRSCDGRQPSPPNRHRSHHVRAGQDVDRTAGVVGEMAM